MQISSAAILLFGKNPQLYFPRARVRFIRYEGTEERVGTQMNVIKDVIFEGNILKMITDAVAYLVQKFLNKWTIFLFCSILFSSNQKEH